MSTPYNNRRILPYSRDDTQPLIDVLAECWGMNVQPQDISFTWAGMTGNVALLPNVIAKGLLYPEFAASFEREKEVLKILNKEVEQQGVSAWMCLGAVVPTYIPAEKKPDVDLFVMSRIGRDTLEENLQYIDHPSVIHQLAKFYIAFDRVMQKHKPKVETGKPALSKMARGVMPIPSLIAEIAGSLPKAREMMDRLDDFSQAQDHRVRCFAHNDINTSNILKVQSQRISQMGEDVRIGIVDFGEIVRTNPHSVFAKMVAAFSAAAGKKGAQAGTWVIERVNNMAAKAGEPMWADPAHCAAMMPLFIAQYAESISWRAQQERRGFKKSEIDYLSRAVEGFKFISQRYPVKEAEVQNVAGFEYSPSRPGITETKIQKVCGR